MLKNSLYERLIILLISVVLLHACKSSSYTTTSDSSSVEQSEASPVFDSSYYQGQWGGALEFDMYHLPLSIEVDGDKVKFSNPLQGAHRVDLKNVGYREGDVEMTLMDQKFWLIPKSESEVYLDVEEKDGKTIRRAILKRGEDLPKPYRPQYPVDSSGYNSSNLTFYNARDSINLAGTLSVPDNPRSAVILLSGSGPSDRDETIFSHRPFAVIASHLARQGVAVLRYDDRGVGDSEGSQAGSTSYDFAFDAAAAHSFLTDTLADLPIGFLGHSEGGMIAQIADSIVGGADFHIYLAGPGMEVKDLMLEQNRLFLGEVLGKEQADIYVSGLEGVFDAVISDHDQATKQDTINYLAKELYNELDSIAAKKIAPSDFFFAMNMNALQYNVWMMYFLRYQPQQYLSQIQCPILALNGEKDIQVVPANLEAIKRDAHLSEVTDIRLPDLNHLMQKCQTGSISEYAMIPETINPSCLKSITNWMSEKGWAN